MSDGCWPIVTSDNNMSESEVLVVRKRQSNLERRHLQWKGDPLVASMFWHDLARIEGLMTCQYTALFVQALSEFLDRRCVTIDGLVNIKIYPEDRQSFAPSATRPQTLQR